MLTTARLAAAIAVAQAIASPLALAWTFQTRFVRRIGATDTVLTDNILHLASGESARIRLQFGVFDDPDSPAPAGGYLGWNFGTLTATGGTNTRTPGRIAPFTFAPNPPGNGLPSTDPWTSLTAIDNTLGTQALIWNCGQEMPPPIIRGRNTFISTYEITTMAGSTDYSFAAAGNLVAAQQWRVIQATPPEDCIGIPGSVLYAPLTEPPRLSSGTLAIIVPAPAAAMLLLSLLAPRAPSRYRS